MDVIKMIFILVLLLAGIMFFVNLIFYSFVELFIAGNLLFLFFKNRKHYYVVVRSLNLFDAELIYLKDKIYGHPLKCLMGIFSKKWRESLWLE